RENLAILLGQETAKDPVAFQELLPDLASGDGVLWKFGLGMALGSDDPDAMWKVQPGTPPAAGRSGGRGDAPDPVFTESEAHPARRPNGPPPSRSRCRCSPMNPQPCTATWTTDQGP